jgi:hypothetical protein
MECRKRIVDGVRVYEDKMKYVERPLLLGF